MIAAFFLGLLRNTAVTLSFICFLTIWEGNTVASSSRDDSWQLTSPKVLFCFIFFSWSLLCLNPLLVVFYFLHLLASLFSFMLSFSSHITMCFMQSRCPYFDGPSLWTGPMDQGSMFCIFPSKVDIWALFVYFCSWLLSCGFQDFVFSFILCWTHCTRRGAIRFIFFKKVEQNLCLTGKKVDYWGKTQRTF